VVCVVCVVMANRNILEVGRQVIITERSGVHLLHHCGWRKVLVMVMCDVKRKGEKENTCIIFDDGEVGGAEGS